MKFDTIILDIDNTIFDYDFCHNLSLRNVFNSICKNYKISQLEIQSQFDKIKKSINIQLLNKPSSHNKYLQFKLLCESFNIYNYEYINELNNVYINTFLENMIYEENFLIFYKNIKNTKIIFLSDMLLDFQILKLIKLNLKKYNFYKLVVSEEVGFEKPNFEIFDYTFKKYNFDKSKTCLIGDNFDKDIIGAINFGIYAFWYNKNKKQKTPISYSEKFVEFSNYIELIKHIS